MKTWIIEDGIFDNQEQLKVACEKNGSKCHIMTVSDISENKKNFTTRTIFYGSINTSLMLRNSSCQIWNHGIDCNKYYPLIDRNYLLNSNYLMVTYRDFIRNGIYYFDLLDYDNIFVRPNSGLKQFTGFVVTPDNYKEEMLKIFMFPEEILLVSRENTFIKDEWRLLVCGGIDEQKVVTGSQYISNKKIIENPNDSVPQEVIDFGNEIIKEIPTEIYPAWTLDVCNVSTRLDDKLVSLQVIEINSFSTAGLYGCDLNVVVQEVNNSLETYL